MNNERPTFGIADYVVCVVMLAASVLIGFYYAYVDRHRQSTHEYMMAGRRMHFLPVSFSLLASFISANTILGLPAEIYLYGTQFVVVCVGYALLMPAAAHVFVPIFYRLKLLSVYEYLEKRFNKAVRVGTSFIFCLQMTIYMSITLYMPSLALNAVTGLSWPLSATVIAVCCTLYTTVGGMKAVLWTDTLQTVIMFGGVVAVLIAGTLRVGGLEQIWLIGAAGHRLEFFNVDPSPTTRHTVWTMSVGGWFLWLSVYGVNQAQVQRALSCRSLRYAQIAYWLNAFGLIAVTLLCSLVGLVVYAYYHSCDPQKAGMISKVDQLVPLFVMETLGHIPGLPGLFVAAVFAGALSTLSSGINSVAAVVMKDLLPNRCLKNLQNHTCVSKLIALAFGVFTGGLSFLISLASTSILPFGIAMFQTTGSPVLGVFVVGIFCPWVNATGALVGLICAQIVTLTINFGTLINDVTTPHLPRSVAACSLLSANNTFNTSLSMNHTMTTPLFTDATTVIAKSPKTDAFALFRISYLWYGIIGVFTVLFVSTVVSLFTGCNRRRPVPSALLWSPVARLWTRQQNDTVTEQPTDDNGHIYAGRAVGDRTRSYDYGDRRLQATINDGDTLPMAVTAAPLLMPLRPTDVA